MILHRIHIWISEEVNFGENYAFIDCSLLLLIIFFINLLKKNTFVSLKNILQKKINFTGPADVETNAITMNIVSSPQAQRRMEAETGEEAEDVGQS